MAQNVPNRYKMPCKPKINAIPVILWHFFKFQNFELAILIFILIFNFNTWLSSVWLQQFHYRHGWQTTKIKFEYPKSKIRLTSFQFWYSLYMTKFEFPISKIQFQNNFMDPLSSLIFDSKPSMLIDSIVNLPFLMHKYLGMLSTE